jgi:hypothetical protein
MLPTYDAYQVHYVMLSIVLYYYAMLSILLHLHSASTKWYAELHVYTVLTH